MEGSDAASYLQGQLSQDVEAVPEGASAWSLLLDPDGKLVAWFRLWHLADGYVIDVEPEVVDAMVARLERFRLRTDVDFTVEPGWWLDSRLRPAGAGGSDARVRPSDASAGALEAGVAWGGFVTTDRLVREPDGESTDLPGYETARIGALVPRMGVDIEPGSIPAEGGRVVIDSAVSFTKGCFTGQELVARVDSRGGNVPRPLRRLDALATVTVGAPVVAPGQGDRDGDRVLGTVTSAVGTHALARVHRRATPGTRVRVGGPDGVEAVVHGD